MRTTLYYIGIGLILVLFLNSSGPNLDTFIPGNPWEHYCKYELHKHPFHTNEKEYNYFLDTFTSTDKYEQIMEIYANPIYLLLQCHQEMGIQYKKTEILHQLEISNLLEQLKNN